MSDVRVAPEAEVDLLVLHEFVRHQSGPDRADQVLEAVEAVCASLADLSGRGHVVPELARLGIIEYRELHWHSWRIIYEAREEVVYVHAVVDVRRSVRDVLLNRLARTGQ